MAKSQPKTNRTTKQRRTTKKAAPQNVLLLNVALGVVGTLLVVFMASMVWRGISGPVDTTRDAAAPALVGAHVQVAVLNGCGVSGLAAQMTTYLRRYGFDVVESGDHSSFDVEHTVIYDRIGNPEAARQLASALGLPEERIIVDVNPDEYLDAAVVIGRDYTELKAYPNLGNPTDL